MSRRCIAGFLASAAIAAISAGVPAAAPAAKVAPASASIALATPDPHLGGNVSFNYTVNVRTPLIAVRCFQNGAQTYMEANYADHIFQLGGAWSEWQQAGGAASCTAELYSIESKPNQIQRYTIHATTAFDAAG